MIKYSIEVWIYNPIIREMLLLKVKTDQFSFWQPITGGIEMVKFLKLPVFGRFLKKLD